MLSITQMDHKIPISDFIIISDWFSFPVINLTDRATNAN